MSDVHRPAQVVTVATGLEIPAKLIRTRGNQSTDMQ